MDELEFRRRLFSDPQSTDAELAHALKNDGTRQQLQQELLQQDKLIKQVLQFEVSEDLAGRLLFNQQLDAWLALLFAALLIDHYQGPPGFPTPHSPAANQSPWSAGLLSRPFRDEP